MNMDTVSIWLAVVSIIIAMIGSAFSVIAAIVIAVWKISLRFSGIEGRLVRVEAKIDLQKKENG